MAYLMKLSGLMLAGLAGGACVEAEESTPTPGNVYVWAGISERGFNIENPTAHRLKSKFYFPIDLTFDQTDRAYILDWNNHLIRRAEPNGSLVTVVGTDYEGDGSPEMEDRLPVCNPAGAIGTTVAMNHMTDVELGPDGKLYIATWHNNKIRVFDPATNVVTALAGDGHGFTGDGGPACSALFDTPKAVAIAPDNTVYTIDQRNVRIRKIQPDAARTITTIAGTGTVGDVGDGGPALEAQFGFEIGPTPRPTGALVLSGRVMYVADSLNNRIRRIDLDTGLVDCIAGQAQPGYSGDGGQALQAQFDFPMDIELGPDGRLYVADRNNHAVRAIDLTTGIIETVVGDGTRCDASRESCADRPARETRLNEPYGIAFDNAGSLYIADSHNHRILKVAR
ncbi:MAG: hypothetical protein H0X17_09115 [Deltaproteobacteria bacterium]|nr:hypothetical protein [Deltaproteobacteria bacterium]